MPTSPPADDATAQQQPRPGQNRSHAFVVDDEAQVRGMVSNVLTACGYIAHQLASGIEVEAALIQWPPSLIGTRPGARQFGRRRGDPHARGQSLCR